MKCEGSVKVRKEGFYELRCHLREGRGSGRRQVHLGVWKERCLSSVRVHLGSHLRVRHSIVGENWGINKRQEGRDFGEVLFGDRYEGFTDVRCRLGLGEHGCRVSVRSHCG